MTNSRAVDRLYNAWLVFTLALGVAVIIQSLAGKYGDDWLIPLQWAFAMVLPSMTIVTAARRNKGGTKWRNADVDRSNFRLAMGMSVFVWAGSVAIFLFEAISPAKIFDILPVAGLVFTIAQAVIISSVSAIAFAKR